MADVNDIMKDVETDDVYYDEEKQEGPVTSGTYEAYIVGLRRKINITTKNGFSCDIYWPRYQIADDSPTFRGRLVRDRGQFRYRSKELRDNNLYYKKYLDKMGISLSQKEIDGNIRYSLPSISEDMILGKKVLINVHIEEWSDIRGHRQEPVGSLIKIIEDV